MSTVLALLGLNGANRHLEDLVSATHKDIPVVVCANKVDDQCERQVGLEDLSWSDEMSGVKCYETSVKTNLNFEEPFLWLTRTLLNDQTLVQEPIPSCQTHMLTWPG